MAKFQTNDNESLDDLLSKFIVTDKEKDEEDEKKKKQEDDKPDNK